VPSWLLTDIGIARDTRITSRTGRARALNAALVHRSRTRPKGSELEQVIGSVPLFAGLPRRTHRLASRVAVTREVPGRTARAREGSAPRQFFVALDGHVEVRKQAALVTTQGPGSHAGGTALLANRLRATTLVTSTPVRTLVVSRREFHRLLDAAPEVS